jgi:hypothetical protein
MTSMLWEFFVAGLLLYGLALLGLPLLTRERKPVAFAWNEATHWARAHPRITTPLRTTTNWGGAPRRRISSAACNSTTRAVSAMGRVPVRRRAPRRRQP